MTSPFLIPFFFLIPLYHCRISAQDCPNARDTSAAKSDLVDAHSNSDINRDGHSDSDLLCFEVSEEMKGGSEASTSPHYGHFNKIKEEGMPHSSLLTLPFQLPVRIRNSKGQLKPDCAEDVSFPVPVPVPVSGPVMGVIDSNSNNNSSKSTFSSSNSSDSNNNSNSNNNSISISISNSNSNISNSIGNSSSIGSSSDKAIDSVGGRQSDGDASRRANHSASIYPVGSAMQFARNKQ